MSKDITNNELGAGWIILGSLMLILPIALWIASAVGFTFAWINMRDFWEGTELIVARSIFGPIAILIWLGLGFMIYRIYKSVL